MAGQQSRVLLVALTLCLSLAALPISAQETEIHVVTAGYPAVLTSLMRDVLIPQFEDETGIKVILESVDWTNRIERILLLHAGGTPPDVVATGFTSPYDEAASGLLAPLTEYLEQWDIRDLIPGPIWDALTWQGEVHVIPQYFDLRAYVYNQNSFADMGFDPETPPEGWEQLVNYARRLTRVDETGRVVQRGFIHHFNAVQNLAWYMMQAGVDPVNRTTFESQLNSREALDALNMMLDLARAGEQYSSPGNPTVPGIATGTIAITYANPQLINVWERAHPGAMEHLRMFPGRRSADSQPIAANFINGLAIPAASQKKDAAWRWIDFLFREDIQREVHAVTRWISPRVDLMGELIDYPGLRYFYDLIAYTWSPLIPPPHDVSQYEFTTWILAALAEDIPPEEALLRGHELWSRLLREWNP